MPHHTHDCDDCTFIGSYVDAENDNIDVYRTCGAGVAPYIARYGSDGSDYATVDIYSPHFVICKAMDEEALCTS